MVAMNRNYNLDRSANRRRFELTTQHRPKRPEGAACPTAEGASPPLCRDSVAGLSKPHTKTTNIPTRSRLTYYKGAALIDIEGPSSCISAIPSRGGKRREISGMSKGSQMRFKQKLAMIKCDEMTNALTVCLTYPRDVVKPEEWQIYKYHLFVFNQSVKRQYPASSGVWALEFQRSGAPHFHLLIFGLRSHAIEKLRQWMQATWYKIAHNGDKHLGRAGTTIEWVKHGGGVMGYMAKYMSKSYQKDRGGHTGRMWGKFGELPMGECKQLALTEKQVIKIRRWARKRMESHVNNARWSAFLNGRNPRKPSPSEGIVYKNPEALGDRMFWNQAKSAFHGGAKSFLSVRVLPATKIEDEVYEYGIRTSSTTTRCVNNFRPPSRWKAKCNDRVRLICHVDILIAAILRAVERNLI